MLINGKTPEEIKEGLRCCLKTNGCSSCPYSGGCIQHGPEEDAVRLIEHLEAKIPKWISVKERLPEHLVDVLVHVGEIVDIGFYDERCNAWECYSYRRGDVTHWMPILELPEEDDENENA